MLKKISVIMLVSAALSACGGSDSGSSKTSSSMPASSVANSTENSVAASSVMSSAEASSVQTSATISSADAISSSTSSTAISSEASSTIVVVTSSVQSSIASSAIASSAEASSETSSSSSSAVSAILSADFEADAVGSTYGSFGWSDPAVIATVTTISSVTGLPAHGASVNVLRVVPLGYGASPKIAFTLPQGKTLANYQLQLDVYFTYATLGLTSSTNYYTDFIVFAGASISGAAADTNADYQTVRHNTPAWDEVDKWLPLTLTFDPTKAAALAGQIEVALGLNRDVGTNADAYYFDNVRLVETP